MAVTTLNRSEQIRASGNTNSVAYNDGSGKLTDGSTLTWDGTTLDVGANITANSSTGALHATSATLTNALPVLSGGTGTTTSTGTGSVVLSTSPTLITPALGTPSTLVLTNATGTPTSIGLTNGTGLPLTTGVTGTLPIANGGTNSTTALSNGFLIVSSGGKIVESAITSTTTGSGNVVLATSPTLVTPALGTPSSATLTNATGLPLTTGVTGTLPVANGGTNSNTALVNGFVIASSGGKLVENPSTNALSMNGGRLTNIADPTSAQDAVSKNYVDMAINGLTWKSPVAAATTTALPFSPTYSNGSSGVGATLTATAFGALVIDGYTVLLNDRVLVQNQASGLQNGIYVQTTVGTGSVDYVLTRATDSNTPTELEAGTSTFATNGTTNANRGFLQTTTGTIVIGTTNLVYITFTSAVSSYVAGNGLDLTGNIFSISTDNSLTAFAGGSTPSLVVKEDPAGAVVTNAGGIAVNVDTTSVVINGSNQLAVKPAGATTQIQYNNSGILGASANFTWNNTNQVLNSTGSISVTASLTGSDATSAEIDFYDTDGTTNLGSIFALSIANGGGFTMSAGSASGGNVFLLPSGGASVGIATSTTLDPSAALTVGVDNGTQGFLEPRMTTTERNAIVSPAEGLQIYNTATHLLDWYNGTTWMEVGTGTLTPANFVTRETPSGAINGINTTFTLANTPTTGTECVYLNGVLQESGAGNDYTISGATITYLTAPQTGDRILVNYMK